MQMGDHRDTLKGLDEAFKRSKLAKRENAQPTNLVQPVIFYTQLIKRFLRKPLSITLPFYSDSVFLREEDAVAFIPYFLKRLIEKGLIPAEAIGPNGLVDQNMIEAGTARLILAFAERSDL